MKAIGVILLIMGILGLVSILIVWMPSRFSPIIVVLISAVCLVAVWGGGALYQSKAVIMAQPAGEGKPVLPSQPDQRFQPAAGILCPRCGCQVTPGQQYCGGCGSSLVSYCARCGAAIREPSRFCGTCGARLN